ncbi:sulfurtransferase [Synoicihabitans lomoniglobus]|nr:sulfurtransferase [Opitutaceae bacterium LMO-M01]
MLISTAELNDLLQQPDVVIFDCRHDLTDPESGLKRFTESHIAGAQFAGVDTDLSGAKNGTNGRHPLPPPSAFAAFLERGGVSASTRVFAYDDVGGQYAARLWWMARWIGFDGVRVLDGGWPKWLAEHRPVTAETTTPVAGQLSINVDESMVLTTDDVVANLAEGAQLVIDARAPARYRGEVEPLDPVAGHIPGAANRFFQDNLQTDTSFRPASELAEAFSRILGDRKPATVIHQCGSGITACANLLAMEHAGLTGSKLYAGSWSEWVADPSRPVATGSR